MQKTKIVPKTKIEMGHRAWNVFKGKCPYACWYCWARDIKRRFKEEDPLRWNEERLRYRFPKEPCRILVCWTIDLMHPYIHSEKIQKIIDRTKEAPHCIFLFLTKNPARYVEFHFPKNCWLGVTVNCQKDTHRIDTLIEHKRKKNLLFVSCEPLLGQIRFTWAQWEYLNWFIVGALTGAKAKEHQPNREDIDYFRFGCQNWKKPLFLKNNLRPIWGDKLIREFPQT